MIIPLSTYLLVLDVSRSSLRNLIFNSTCNLKESLAQKAKN